jgi:predicted dehydrogenase
VVFNVHNWKYAPIFLQMSQLIDTGTIGTVTHVELHTLRTRPAINTGANTWRTNQLVSGGGILVDHGWHNFYLLQRLLHTEPRAVSAHLVVPRHEAVEEEAACWIEYPQCSAVLYLTWRAPTRANWGVVYGTTGSLEMRDDVLLLTQKDGSQQKFEFAQKLSHGSAHPDWFQVMLEDFEAEIKQPELRYRSLREATTCSTLLTYINQSHRLGGKTLSMPTHHTSAFRTSEIHSSSSGPHAT